MSDSKHFQIIQTVATGGTAVLFKAVQVSLDRIVAVKKLHAHLTQDENFTRRFVLEAKAAASLDHENIVRVIDFGVEDGSYQMVMEFVEGESLKDVLERWRPVRPDLALALVHQILRGLEHAHAKGIVHRDIKPGNVMLTQGGVAKVTDFGLAKLTHGNTMQTAADSILGTPLYMSPEQAFGESVDQRSDLFSLGTVLYELLTGKQPFVGDNYMGVIQNIIHVEAPTVRSLNPQVPAEVEALVTRALAKNRDQRFASARQFREAVEDVLGLEGLRRASAGLPLLLERNTDTRIMPRTETPPAVVSSSSARLVAEKHGTPAWASTSSQIKKKSRPGGIWAAAVVATVVLGGAGAYFLWPHEQSIVASPDEPARSVQEASVMGSNGMHLSDMLASPAPTDSTAMLDSSLASAPADTVVSNPVVSTTSTEPAVTVSDATANNEVATKEPEPAATEESKPVEKPASETKRVPAEPEKIVREGYLSIHVEQNAQVYVDGVYRGDANPSLRLTLTAGNHTIECKEPRFETYLEQLRIVPGELSRRSITLKKQQGIISLATQEGAEFFVDGIFIGTTPIMKPIEVSAGTHSLMLKKADFFTWTSEVTIEPNQTLPLKIMLSPRY